MADVIQIAEWFCLEYRGFYKKEIDEMKLHKLLYLSQRESFVRNGCALFADEFEAWKYGPVLVKVRNALRDGMIYDASSCLSDKDLTVLRYVFDTYAGKTSWSLSRLTHAETSWKKARGGLPDWERSDAIMNTDDIRVDAENIARRRAALSRLGLACA